jgi:hypothetical protein
VGARTLRDKGEGVESRGGRSLGELERLCPPKTELSHRPGEEAKFDVSLPCLRKFNAVIGKLHTIECKVIGYKYNGNYNTRWTGDPENGLTILEVSALKAKRIIRIRHAMNMTKVK